MAKLERIAPELPSANLDSALAYYEKKLGFEVALRLPGNEYAIVERDDVAIHCSSMGRRSRRRLESTFSHQISTSSSANCKPPALPSPRKSSKSPGATAIFAFATNLVTS